jgi:hypothetical protein
LPAPQSGTHVLDLVSVGRVRTERKRIERPLIQVQHSLADYGALVQGSNQFVGALNARP